MAIGGLSLAGLIMSHNIMALIFFPMIALYAFWQFLSGQKNKLHAYALLFLLGFSISCFFWLPALYDRQYTVLDQVVVAQPTEHFPSLKQLLVPSWGYGSSIPGDNDEISFQLGIVHLLGIFALVYFLVRFWQKLPKERGLILFYLAIFSLAVWLMLPISGFIWNFLPAMGRIQFPWRLLAITSFANAFLIGAISLFVKQKILLLGLVVLLITISLPYVKPQYFVDRGEGFYTTNEATTTVKDEYLPLWVSQKPTSRPAQKVEVVQGEAIIDNLSFDSRQIAFGFNSEFGAKIRINTIYFPGWQAMVDGQNQLLEHNNERGLMVLAVPAGSHQAKIVFKETPLRLAADIISLLGLSLTIWILIKGKNEKTQD